MTNCQFADINDSVKHFNFLFLQKIKLEGDTSNLIKGWLSKLTSGLSAQCEIPLSRTGMWAG